MATYIIIAIIAYAIGSINFSVIISKKMAGFDIRDKGSGNAGSTNMLRSIGKKAAILTLVCDILKGVVAVLIAVVVGKLVKNVDKAALVQKRWKRCSNIIRCFINDKLENWTYLFSFCASYNGTW